MQNKNLAIVCLVIAVVWLIGNQKQNQTKIIKVAEASDRIVDVHKTIETPILSPQDLKVVTYTQNEIKTHHEAENTVDLSVESEEMRISYYSDADSCHFPVGDGTCYNAIGKIARVGTAACPRDMINEVIEVEGIGELICEDKYAKWVEEKHGRTIDVFLGYGKTDEAIKKGVDFKQVTIK